MTKASTETNCLYPSTKNQTKGSINNEKTFPQNHCHRYGAYYGGAGFRSALAATVSWQSDSFTYVAEVIKKGVPGSLPVNVTSSETYHTMGRRDYIYAGIRSVTSTGDVEFPSYTSQLRQAATAEGVNYTLTSNVKFTQDKIIPPNYATGTYCLVSTVLGISGEYHVYKIGGGASSTIKSGTFACAPVGYSGVITGLYLMSPGEQPIN